MKSRSYLITMILLLAGSSCSHKYDAGTLGLEFYQWNLWQDTGADPGNELPSCGWEELHRGMGLLVRIPATIEEHFPGTEEPGVYWYHCRFTLPEQWDGRPVSLIFKETGPTAFVFLNEIRAGFFQGEEGVFELDVSESIFYTRDNHLSLRISTSGGVKSGKHSGISGTVLVQPATGKEEIRKLTE
ncbi:MAG: hypothetical protein P1P86_11935 [Bacteroidales bacterium]|nr:hypothetical protein [Bacteroidales bacterium]